MYIFKLEERKREKGHIWGEITCIERERVNAALAGKEEAGKGGRKGGRRGEEAVRGRIKMRE